MTCSCETFLRYDKRSGLHLPVTIRCATHRKYPEPALAGTFKRPQLIEDESNV